MARHDAVIFDLFGTLVHTVSPGEEHTWFDTNYRLDALEWRGATIADIGELTRFLA